VQTAPGLQYGPTIAHAGPHVSECSGSRSPLGCWPRHTPLRRSGASYAIVRVNSPVSREHFDKLLGGAEPGEERIVVHADDDQDIDGLGPTRMYVGNLASVLVDAAFNEATQGKTFGVATMLESPGARGAGAWREEVARVPLDSERDDPWPEDLFEPAPRETCA